MSDCHIPPVCEYLKFSLLTNFHVLGTLTHADFNSTPFNITFNAGDTIGRANVTLFCDNKMERFEFFNLSLVLRSNNPQLAVGKNTSTVQINDITGKEMI